jgi:hypothetical protein
MIEGVHPMYVMKGSLRASLVLLLALSQLSCSGKKSKSFNAVATVIPPVPIVFTVDTKDSAGRTVTAPWYEFHINVENKTGDTFTIVAIKIETTGLDATGTFSTVKAQGVPSDYDYSLQNLSCSYGSFGTWAPGDNLPLSLTGTGGCQSGIAGFQIGGNPNPGGANPILHYTVKVEILGWFGTFNEATDRFDRTIYFTTQ